MGDAADEENTPLNQRTRQWPNWDTFTTDLEFAHSTYRDIVGCEAKEVCALDRDEQAGGCMNEMYEDQSVKVKKQPPDLTAGEFNRREC